MNVLRILLLLVGTHVAGLQAAAPDRVATLKSISAQVIAPGFSNVTARFRELHGATIRFQKNPTTNELAAVREEWRQAMRAWKESVPAQFGPSLEVASRIYYFPVRRRSMDNVLKDSTALTPNYLAQLGATALGLGTLEYQLFSPKISDEQLLATFTGSKGERRRDYVAALAGEILREAETVSKGWAPAGAAQRTFAETGQNGLNELFNAMVSGLEQHGLERLRITIGFHASNLVDPDLHEGGNSATLLASIQALIHGAHRVYTGGTGPGYDDLVTSLNPTLAKRVDTQFQKVRQRFESFGPSLTAAWKKDPAALDQGLEELRALEILLKVDVASTLGIPITFSSTDGD